MGRWTFHYGEWGLAPKIMQQAVKNLGHNAWDQMVDLFSSTTAVQPSATSAISRWPEDHHKILHRPNALNYHWGEDECLRTKTLYAHPPPTLIPQVLQKIEDDKVQIILTVPLYETKPDWWQTFVQMASKFTLIPWHPKLHVYPAGPEHAPPDLKRWPLIIAQLSPIAWRKQVVMTNWETTFAKPIAMTQVDTAWVLGQTTPPTITNVWNEDDLYKIVAKCY